MRIFYIHRTRGKGVEGVHISGIVDSFRALGHQVAMICPDGEEQEAATQKTSPESGKKNLKARLYDVLSNNMPELVFELLEIFYNFSAAGDIRAQAKKQDADMVYERYAIFACAGARYAKKKNIPLILEVNYTASSPLVRQRSKLMAPLAKAFDRYIFKRASVLSVVSSNLKEHLIYDFGIPEEKIIVVPNAADPDKFSLTERNVDLAKELDLASDNAVIGFVGGFYPWHGVDLLVEAFSRIAKENDKAKLLLVGDGPERPAILNKVEALGLQDKVVFTGKVSHEVLSGYISLMDIGVMPDSNEYGSPMKIFEYMAQGKPVVGPDYAPLEDVIVSGEHGFLFEKKNADSLSQALSSLVNDDALREKIGKNVRAAVVERHNWLQNAKENLAAV